MKKTAYFDTLYADRNSETLRLWQQENRQAHKHPAKSFYPDGLKALTCGILPELNSDILDLLDDLRRLTRDDPLADVMQVKHFHVTFLPLTPARYHNRQQIPMLSELIGTFRQCVTDLSLRVEGLRLVALPDQLLLAGFPDSSAIAQRAAFWNALMLSETWRDLLLERHGGKTTPPEFWHTTLLRYRSACLPDSVKACFVDNRHRRYGDIAGDIRLVFAVYNWANPETITA